MGLKYYDPYCILFCFIRTSGASLISLTLLLRIPRDLSEHKVDLCSDPQFAGSPDLSAMILDDLFYDGKADSASALAGVSRGIRPIESVEDIRKFFLTDTFSVVLDLHLDKIAHIHNPDIDDSILFIHVL